MNSINFVTGKNVDVERQLKKVRLFRIIAIASLLLVASLSILVFVITLLLPLSSVKKQQSETLLGISNLHKKLVTHVLIKDRLSNISSVLGLRKELPQISDSIISKLPQELTIKAFTVESGNINMIVNGASLFAINQFINDIILVTDNNNNIKNFTVSSLVYDVISQDYNLSIKADLF